MPVDLPGMGRMHGIAVAGTLALGMTIGMPASVAAGGSLPSTSSAVRCQPPAAAAPRAAAQPHAGGSSFAVSVPRFTFLVKTGDGWVVRTNTEAAPDPRDRFVVIADGGWSLASTTLTDLALRTCG